MTQKQGLVFKCVVIGDYGCGKTTILTRCAQSISTESKQLTIGVDFFLKNIQIKNFDVRLHIWDMSTGNRFQYMRHRCYRGVLGCIAVFDLTNRRSLEHIPASIQEVRNDTENIQIVLVGNKSDLIESRCVAHEEAKNVAQSLNAHYIECSAKNGDGIEEIFTVLTPLMLSQAVNE